jgi:hypothetical protein
MSIFVQMEFMNYRVFEQYGKYGGVPGLIILAAVLIIFIGSKTGVLGKLSGSQTFALLIVSMAGIFLSFCYWVYKTNDKNGDPIKKNHLYKMTIAGHVEDADEHFSVDGVTVSFDSLRYKTVSDGNFFLTILSKDSPTIANIHLDKIGYESYTKVADLPGPSMQLVIHKLRK